MNTHIDVAYTVNHQVAKSDDYDFDRLLWCAGQELKIAYILNSQIIVSKRTILRIGKHRGCDLAWQEVEILSEHHDASSRIRIEWNRLGDGERFSSPPDRIQRDASAVRVY